MKKFRLLNIIIILGAILIVPACDVDKTKEAALKDKPYYDFQKTYLLRQTPLYFALNYNVWKNIPVDIMELGSIKETKSAKVFKVFQRIELVGESFNIDDRVNKKKLLLKKENSADNKSVYSISFKNEKIGEIKQIEAKDILNFELTYKKRVFKITGNIKKLSEKVYAFQYEISDGSKSICKIFKEYKYFINEYEIYINREFGFVDDPIFITAGVFLDSILRENGYQYK